MAAKTDHRRNTLASACSSSPLALTAVLADAGWDPGLWHVNGRFDIGLTVTECTGPVHCEAVIRYTMPDTNVLIGPESN